MRLLIALTILSLVVVWWPASADLAYAEGKAQFRLVRSTISSACSSFSANVAVGVPPGTRLHDETLAHDLLEQGKDYAVKDCPEVLRGAFSPHIEVMIFEGEIPETLLVTGGKNPLVWGYYKVSGEKITLENYENHPAAAFREEQAKLASKKRWEEGRAAGRHALPFADFFFFHTLRGKKRQCPDVSSVDVIGIVSDQVDLRQENTAEAYIEEALNFFHTECSPLLARLCEEEDRCWWRVRIRLTYEGAGLSQTGDTLRDEVVADYEGKIRPRESRRTGVWHGARHRWLPHEADRAVIDQAESRVDTKAQYRITENRCHKKFEYEMAVVVEVPQGLDLGDDDLAAAYAASGLRYALTQCDKMSTEPEWKPPWTVSVSVTQEGTERVKAIWRRPNEHKDPLHVKEYKNFIVSQREAEEEARKKAELAKTEAEKKEAALRPIRERYQAFLQRHRVAEHVSCTSLLRNPYLFERKIVATAGIFDTMVARDKAAFEVGEGCVFAVSSIPRETFGTRRVWVLIAGEVLGYTEVKAHVVTAQVPHLRFVGFHICSEEKCADILPFMNK